MIIIRKKQNTFLMHHIASSYSDMQYKDFGILLNLCRVRLGKCKQHEDSKEPLTIIKVPFIGLWLVW